MDMPHSTTHDASPAPCQRCGMAGATCCTIDPTDASLCFPVSRSEWERIVDHCDKRGGFATEPNTRPFVDNLIRLFPGEAREIERLFPPHGFHLRLAVDAKGNCAFLGPEGCTLPREVRPWYCLVAGRAHRHLHAIRLRRRPRGTYRARMPRPHELHRP